MTIEQIRNFIYMADAGSFGRAEEKTHLTKQALKKQLDVMEAELEVQLVIRTRQGLRLTEAGELFCRSARDSLRQWDVLMGECRTLSRGRKCLRIGNPAHPRILLEGIINEYVCLYPDISVNISIVSSVHDRIQRLQNNELDLAEIVYRPNDIPEGFNYMEVDILTYHCVMLDTHPLADRKELILQDLKEFELALTPGYNADLTDEIYKMNPDSRIHILSDTSMETVYNVCYNHGIYLSKSYYARHMEPLVSIPLRLHTSFSCGVVYRSSPPEQVQKFLNLIPEFRDRGNTDESVGSLK